MLDEAVSEEGYLHLYILIPNSYGGSESNPHAFEHP